MLCFVVYWSCIGVLDSADSYCALNRLAFLPQLYLVLLMARLRS
jgi:hypothetical protein